MFHWLRERRRQRRLAEPLPEAWDAIIRTNVAHDAWLDRDERKHLRDLLRIFIAEKRWEGCGGLEVTDEIRVTIAAQACLLILNLPHDGYRQVRTILVYPSTVVVPPRPLRAFEIPTAPVRGPTPVLGEAWLRGPVVLVWDAVRRNSRHPETGHNVVYHEFAHKLDMLDGLADGTPPLHGREEIRRWAEVCSREYLALRDRVAQGKPGLLDAYGATNEAEFFAVATEEFFDRPVALRTRHPELYEVLQGFYRQDPAARIEARSSSVRTA